MASTAKTTVHITSAMRTDATVTFSFERAASTGTALIDEDLTALIDEDSTALIDES